MRIWDLSPSYLNRNSLLGEHRELHAIYSILKNGKKGYSKHPETLRWVDKIGGLYFRHQLIKSEMELRGYNEKSPIDIEKKIIYPEVFIDFPKDQIKILKDKYIGKEMGRVLFPKNTQQLWSHFKYSIMARDVELYKKIGKEITKIKKFDKFDHYFKIFNSFIYKIPEKNRVKNSLQHMWGYISKYRKDISKDIDRYSNIDLLNIIREDAVKYRVDYILNSTAIIELYAWCQIVN